ncbi:staphylokinase domain-containing protein [Staphylococcus agnetis]|uniref:Staphylokinase n=1 Tax=Staphylococcus agnetis TaxID=985762 RepID=A0ABX3Z274_9STAP|nr:staphylokinase domain-containing protein [Staphylococcus agnetis]OSP22567.1 hypothetical protein B9L42_00375 [Staphylococcus agnetis]OSP23142.1 hypothetical protein B9M87_09420 [Staphylococcus agnetis]OTW30539.1 hypothetical protein B9M88_09730 [Staphylococcus agnetis]
MFKKVLGSVVVSTVALTGVASTLPTSNIVLANEYDGIGSRDYQEIQGTYLLIHVTGVNEKGEEVFYPKYLEFPLEVGEVINKQMLLERVQIALDNSAYNKYEVVSIDPKSKIELNDRDNRKYFDITDTGIKVEDFSHLEKSPSYRLMGNVVVKEKEHVETRKKYDESTQVNLIHDVTFKKLQGNINNVIPIGIDKETSFSKKLKVNSEIDPDELFKAAEEAFKNTPESKQGYKLVKRLSTTVLENARTKKEIYHHLYNPFFNYTISDFRENPTKDGHFDTISESYYISKNGDDFMPVIKEYVINLKNSDGKILDTLKVSDINIKSVDDVKNYLNNNGYDKLQSKDGSTYKFSGMIKKNGESYTVIYQ